MSELQVRARLVKVHLQNLFERWVHRRANVRLRRVITVNTTSQGLSKIRSDFSHSSSLRTRECSHAFHQRVS
uniref:Uncharacterized protein n=1 Tax=Arabidopsis thaliana TaxID=3702 RepID=Q0WQ86_ARATH|nr:hypothetical protein [Arabidopsis thaliana]